jgi:hypothetical protein
MTHDDAPAPDEASQICLKQTRAMVINLLATSVAVMLLGGLALRGMDRGATLWPETLATRLAHGFLFGIIFLSYCSRRALASRSALRDPERRGRRFYRAHVLSASIAALAVPLGLAHGYAIRPRLDAVGPFWVAALALEFLAIPRGYELTDFDAPMPLSADERERWR